MTPVIRDAIAGDRAFLSSLASRLADFDHPPAWRPAELIAAGDRRDLLAALEQPPAGSRLMIAELDDVPAGALHVVTRTDFFTLAPHGHVSVIAVTRDAEGRGVARALMAWADTWARAQHFPCLTLNLFPANTRARAFYEQQGFELDLISMRKGLD